MQEKYRIPHIFMQCNDMLKIFVFFAFKTFRFKTCSSISLNSFYGPYVEYPQCAREETNGHDPTCTFTRVKEFYSNKSQISRDPLTWQGYLSWRGRVRHIKTKTFHFKNLSHFINILFSLSKIKLRFVFAKSLK